MVGLLTLAVVALVVASMVRFNNEVEEATAGVQDTRYEIPEDTRPVVLVVGDSYVGGSAMNSGPTWPTQMAGERGWVIATDGIGGSGYINGDQDQAAFIDRAAADCQRYKADVVVVAGGINDAGKYPAADITKAATKVVKKFERCEPGAEVVMLSPFAPASVTPTIADLDAALAQAARDLGVPYFEVTELLDGRSELVGSDGVHPNDQGHRFLALKIGELLAPTVEAGSAA